MGTGTLLVLYWYSTDTLLVLVLGTLLVLVLGTLLVLVLVIHWYWYSTGIGTLLVFHWYWYSNGTGTGYSTGQAMVTPCPQQMVTFTCFLSQMIPLLLQLIVIILSLFYGYWVDWKIYECLSICLPICL